MRSFANVNLQPNRLTGSQRRRGPAAYATDALGGVEPCCEIQHLDRYAMVNSQCCGFRINRRCERRRWLPVKQFHLRCNESWTPLHRLCQRAPDGGLYTARNVQLGEQLTPDQTLVYRSGSLAKPIIAVETQLPPGVPVSDAISPIPADLVHPSIP